MGSGEAHKLPQRVRAEPGRQTYFDAFSHKFAPFDGLMTNNMFCSLAVLDPRVGHAVDV